MSNPSPVDVPSGTEPPKGSSSDWSNGFIAQHYKPHKFTTHEHHHKHKHFGMTDAEVDTAAHDAANGLINDLKQGKTGATSDHSQAARSLGTLEEEAKNADTKAERGYAERVLHRTEQLLSEDKQLQELGFRSGDTIIGTDSNGHFQIKSSDDYGSHITTEGERGKPPVREAPADTTTEGQKEYKRSIGMDENGEGFNHDQAIDKVSGKVLDEMKTYPGGKGQDTVNGQSIDNVNSVTRHWDDKSQRYKVSVSTQDGQIKYTTDKDQKDEKFEATAEPGELSRKSTMNPTGDQYDENSARVDHILDGTSGTKRVTGSLKDSGAMSGSTQYTLTDQTDAHGKLTQRDIQFEYHHPFFANKGKDALKVTGPDGQEHTLKNITAVKYKFNGVGYDVSFNADDGHVVNGKTSPDGGKIVSWDYREK